jgi:hypothetical protein
MEIARRSRVKPPSGLPELGAKGESDARPRATGSTRSRTSGAAAGEREEAAAGRGMGETAVGERQEERGNKGCEGTKKAGTKGRDSLRRRRSAAADRPKENARDARVMRECALDRGRGREREGK